MESIQEIHDIAHMNYVHTVEETGRLSALVLELLYVWFIMNVSSTFTLSKAQLFKERSRARRKKFLIDQATVAKGARERRMGGEMQCEL